MALRFDPDAARRMLDDAGWVVSGDRRAKDGEPLQLDLLVPSTPGPRCAGPAHGAVAVAAALQAVGIGVTINTVDASAFYDNFYGRDWDLVRSSKINTCAARGARPQPPVRGKHPVLRYVAYSRNGA